MALSDINSRNIDPKTVKDLVSKALTIKYLKELEVVQDSDDEFKKLVVEQDKGNIDYDIYDKNEENLEFDAIGKEQKKNKKVFIRKYGVEVLLPAFYIQDAKLYPKNISYCLKVVKYAIPKNKMKVTSYVSG